jgi:ATP-dependent DNA ligase
MNLPVMPPLRPMLAKATSEIPPGMFYEPKWDGFRSIVFRDGDEVEIGSRNERPMTRYFPEVAEAVRANLPERCVVDGEIVVPGAEGLDFWSLQQRLHPAASRVSLLAAATPARFIAFDLLALGDDDYMARPFGERRAALEEALAGAAPPVHLTPITRDRELARQWFELFEGAGLDGLVAKRADSTYQPDKRVMVKVKHVRTADCVVAGYRVHKSGPGAIGSLLLGLYRDESAPPAEWAPISSGLAPVGVVAAFPMARRRELFAGAAAAGDELRASSLALGGPARRAGAPRDGEPLESREVALLRPAAAGARGRGPLRPHGGLAVPPPAAVPALAPRPRPRLVRLRAARAAGALRPRRRPARRGLGALS